jgi:acetoacetyl-CoA reductase
MSRVALVTGGSRGIGAAISRALMAEGYRVAASYAGNDAAAQAFSQETGIRTYKWNVADYEACKAGIAQVEGSSAPSRCW